MTARTLHSDVLDAVGTDIVSAVLPAGATLTLETLQTRYGVSRTVARECMRILESMRLVVSRRRTGLVIQPVDRWNVLDRQVIRWRLHSSARAQQLQSLTELRLGVEPMAAALAARRANEGDHDVLRVAAAELRMFGDLQRRDRYLAADITFHTTLLRASGNEMYAALSDMVAEVLAEQPLHGHSPTFPTPESVDRHEAVMTAVCAGDAAAAEREMLRLLSDVKIGLVAAIGVAP